jgi:16S rRNA (guanine527-N7)-methyltransferase
VNAHTPGAGAPAAPQEAAELFGAARERAVRYAELLAGEGVLRGLIGPREVERLWGRHLMNCAVLGEAVPEGASLCDVGSGAGLPGIPLALVRPDLRITLLEPLLRRTTFLEEAVELLELGNVTVLRGRAEEMVGRLRVDVVTARAVAPLERLAGWGLPLLRAGGEMLALKGDSAAEELSESQDALAALGAVGSEVFRVGEGIVDPPATVVRVRVGDRPGGVRAAARRAKGEKAAVRRQRPAARSGRGKRT